MCTPGIFFIDAEYGKVSNSQYSPEIFDQRRCPPFSSSVYGDRARGNGMKKVSKAFVTNNGYP
jgi:hypothetical protein